MQAGVTLACDCLVWFIGRARKVAWPAGGHPLFVVGWQRSSVVWRSGFTSPPLDCAETLGECEAGRWATLHKQQSAGALNAKFPAWNGICCFGMSGYTADSAGARQHGRDACSSSA